MPKVDLRTLLQLVGSLSDSEEPDSSCARFRNYLGEHLELATDVHEYVEDALAASGDQFNKALQDLINHLGHCLGVRRDLWSLSRCCRGNRL